MVYDFVQQESAGAHTEKISNQRLILFTLLMAHDKSDAMSNGRSAMVAARQPICLVFIACSMRFVTVLSSLPAAESGSATVIGVPVSPPC